MDGTTAFALGGLAGNNAHGAGFLQAALDRDVRPIMISCTSGQILWVYRYLTIRFKGERKSLKQFLEEDIASVRPTGNVNLDLALLCTFGKPGVFRPANVEYLGDMFGNACMSFRNVMTQQADLNLAQEFRQLFPCRVLISDIPESLFNRISDEFESAEIGIVFNSYNPKSGDENVYLNCMARKMLNKSEGIKDDYRDRITFRATSPGAVRDALHIYEYGFDRKESEFVDGAYFRDMILSELTSAQKIFSVRPINHHWQGRMPHNEPDMADLKTEIGFDGSYCGERYQIRLINKLVGGGAFSTGKYHYIDLEEIEIERPRGFFDYVFESMEVFNDAYRQGLEMLSSQASAFAGSVGSE